MKSQIFTRSWVWGATEKDKTWLNRLISCRPEIRLWSVGPVPASLRQHQKSFRHTWICSLLSFHYSHLFRSHVWIRLQFQLKTIWFKPIFFRNVRCTFRKRASRVWRWILRSLGDVWFGIRYPGGKVWCLIGTKFPGGNRHISRCPGGNLKIAAAHPEGVSGSCGLSTNTVPGPTQIKLFWNSNMRLVDGN